ncbi:MAG: hypothetical protein AB1391_03295 [Candidatus Micrarchaeota archaeon]
MSIKLLIKKLNITDEKFIISDLFREYCKKLNIEYYGAIRYLITHKYVYRILRGIFYKPGFEERKLKKIDIDYKKAIAEALKIKKIRNWYFGLESALKLNNITHEYFATDFLISDTLFRANTITILGHEIRFIKIKKDLCKFGVKEKELRFSDLEKTVLDIIYLSRYDNLSDIEIKNKITNLLGYCSKNKLLKYSKKYNQKVYSFVKEIS